MVKVVVRTVALGAVVAMLAACGTTKQIKDKFSNKKLDYKSSRKGKSLEVPPDLTAPGSDNTMAIPSTSGSASYSAYSSTRRSATVSTGSNVLLKNPAVRMVRDRDKRWLVISAPPKQVWTAVREFWIKNGFVLAKENAAIGIMETDWAENRANIPTGPIRRIIGKVFSSAYSSGTRDRFRVRLERGETPGSTELYLTHRGLVEEVQGDPLSPTGTVWKPRKRDAELEIEVLKRLMLHLGVHKQRIIAMTSGKKAAQKTKARSHLARGDGGVHLVVDEGFSKAWRLIGLALDRTGFTVEDRNRSKGIYYVRFNDPDLSPKKKKKGFMSKMKFWKGKKKGSKARTYQIHVKSDSDTTRVTVHDDKGAAENSSVGTRIMSLLHKNLK